MYVANKIAVQVNIIYAIEDAFCQLELYQQYNLCSYAINKQKNNEL